MQQLIAIYRGTSSEPEFAVGLWEVVEEGLHLLFGPTVELKLKGMLFFSVPEEEPLAGHPRVSNLNPDWGYLRVKVLLNGGHPYAHPHTVSELITAPLQRRLRANYPEEPAWGFCVLVRGMPGRPTVRAEPFVAGAIGILPYEEGEVPLFRIRPIPDPPLPVAALRDFGVATFDDAVRGAAVKVLVRRELDEELRRHRTFSDQVEEGGFLVGRVYEDRDRPGTHIIDLTAAPPAEHTGASLLHFTFTGDSFEAVKRSLRDVHAGNRLTGWYHTHLFPATAAMGLSSIDLKLHFTTFRQPWQLAGLLNLEADRRVLRFYVRHGDQMVDCPQWVIG
jgi:hypothetical protein